MGSNMITRTVSFFLTACIIILTKNGTFASRYDEVVCDLDDERELTMSGIVVEQNVPQCTAANVVEQNVQQCTANASVASAVDQVLALGRSWWGNGQWTIPQWKKSFDTLKNQPSPSTPFQAVGDGEGFDEWHANVLPSTFHTSNILNIPGLPPLYPFTKQMPLIFNRQADFASLGYQKWPLAVSWVDAVTGKDPSTAKSSDINNSIFNKNLEDRGEDNQLKKQYMSALTCDKLPLYENKIDTAINNFYQDITTDRKPILSSWYNRAFELYLDLHLHGTRHPAYVMSFVKDCTQLLSPGNDGTAARNKEILIRARCAFPYVQAYFESRRQYIVKNDINSTFVYHWDRANIHKESLVFEAIHNILAWGQFVNTLFLVIRSKLQGYTAITNIISPTSTILTKLDFFAKFQAATTDNQRLDVAREVYRLLLPNGNWMSAIQTSSANLPNGKQPISNHLPLLIQAMNDDYNSTSYATNAGNYDTARYANFQPAGCPFLNQETDPDQWLDYQKSPIDGETVMPTLHAKYYPVYGAGSRKDRSGLVNGPKYCPFGLGYRRCPGELFNMLILQKLLQTLVAFDFVTVPATYDLFKGVGYDGTNSSVPMANGRAMDNLFIKQ